MRCEDIHESIQEQEERLSISAVIIKNLRYIIWLKHWYNVRKNICLLYTSPSPRDS